VVVMVPEAEVEVVVMEPEEDLKVEVEVLVERENMWRRRRRMSMMTMMIPGNSSVLIIKMSQAFYKTRTHTYTAPVMDPYLYGSGGGDCGGNGGNSDDNPNIQWAIHPDAQNSVSTIRANMRANISVENVNSFIDKGMPYRPYN